MKSICVYCGSSPGERPEYKAGAIALGNEMVGRGLTLVYGGGNIGLMGIVADAVLRGGNPVIGIIPKSLVCKEVGHKDVTELHIVDSMHQRKQMMADRADAFIAMPGGIGTYEELFETFTWLQLGYHGKPIGLLNVAGFYDKLLAFIDHAVEEGFLKRHHADLLHVSADPAELIDRLERAPRHPVDKWAERRERT
ncbi:TIGR00730 family Rossman fold protein [Ralstonia pseudosolanacearum]|uniref:LOG family protein n=1 Tax=Ralstonia pseudosolanacearum TaxID=1310165 RepID=UPI0006BCF519|nr:TIGR00730 family Rossman fold protein [Ralstonia pseudosolanacearum]AKZ26000.1 LOG family protein [Ralstonia solanacearum]BCL91748.1 putative cytokinin riboside 5'-monophosphate phosphoribohydrolase [Ralstonia solanacearum]BCL97929.1 putative cytokinin riboside 5'-monophosphate phosphoribohydrolase [Ralstonia solanacearum]BCM13371.1 putative cytokinin riboside 5'-monophosphate phosphoribohydrolase [Ralstonia solanacearum]BCN04312.1 putative cytokinin riboside 5'-monophosphate phosphoribohyd